MLAGQPGLCRNGALLIYRFQLFFNTGVFSAGAWPLLGNLEDPELRRLAQSLPATVLRSRADSTTKKYLGAFQRWKTWAEARQGVPSFPVQELHLVLYMQHLSESTESKAAVEEAVHALSWLHGLAGLQPFGGSPLVKATLEGLRHILAKPKVRKQARSQGGFGGFERTPPQRIKVLHSAYAWKYSGDAVQAAL